MVEDAQLSEEKQSRQDLILIIQYQIIYFHLGLCADCKESLGKWFEFDYSREGPEQCCGKSEKESVSSEELTRPLRSCLE